MVEEAGVLLRVQEFEKGAGWIALVAAAKFVDFVNEDL